MCHYSSQHFPHSSHDTATSLHISRNPPVLDSAFSHTTLSAIQNRPRPPQKPCLGCTQKSQSISYSLEDPWAVLSPTGQADLPPCCTLGKLLHCQAPPATYVAHEVGTNIQHRAYGHQAGAPEQHGAHRTPGEHPNSVRRNWSKGKEGLRQGCPGSSRPRSGSRFQGTHVSLLTALPELGSSPQPPSSHTRASRSGFPSRQRLQSP